MKKNRHETESHSQNLKYVYAAAAIIIILVPTAFFFQFLTSGQNQPKAAIIDQLSSSHLAPFSQHPNQTFIDLAKNLLNQRFDTIDYYRDNATVENYKQIPSQGYKLIIWRAHSALDNASKYVAISTSDRENLIYYDQYMQNRQLTLCNITGDPYLYFAINPKFIREIMNGRFEDTVIILMSCNGLKQGYTETAKALLDKGAKLLISWDGWVDSGDNDDAATHLLDYLINKNYTVNQAVQNSTQGLLSTLHYYPETPGAADYRIPDYRRQNTTQSTATATFLKKTEQQMAE